METVLEKFSRVSWILSIPLLVLPFIEPASLTKVLPVLFCILGIEILCAICSWCIIRENWPCFVASTWLFTCALAAFMEDSSIWTRSFSKEYFPYFLWLMLLGYTGLRAGMHFSVFPSKLRALPEEAAKLCSPEKICPRNYTRVIQLICLISSLAVLSFYLYYNCFPSFTDKPALYRYAYFNGPNANSLVRFAFRTFSAISVVSLLFMVVFLKKKEGRHNLLLSCPIVLLALFCSFASGSRGDISMMVLFIFIMIIFSLAGWKRFFVSLALFSLFAALFCFFSYYRTKYSIRLLTLFPEAFDASILLEAFHKKEVPWAMGKTYLAAFLSFIPSAIFPFREAYGFGRYSLEILFSGNAAPTYGGLRPSFVGEAYLNFGVPGVFFIGYLLGAVLGLWQKGTASLRNSSGAMVFFFLFSLLTVMVSDFYGIFHAFVLIALLMWAMRRIMERFGHEA